MLENKKSALRGVTFIFCALSRPQRAQKSELEEQMLENKNSALRGMRRVAAHVEKHSPPELELPTLPYFSNYI